MVSIHHKFIKREVIFQKEVNTIIFLKVAAILKLKKNFLYKKFFN